MDSSTLQKAREWADKECPYPNAAPWEAGTAAAFFTLIGLIIFCDIVGVSEERGWPAIALFVAVVGGGTYLEFRQRARRHVRAYLEALEELRRNAEHLGDAAKPQREHPPASNTYP